MIFSNEKKGYLFQSVEFEYQYIENSNYYRDGEKFNMYQNAVELKNQNNLGLNYLIRSRSGYSFWFFTFYLEYLFSINQDNQYSGFDVKIDSESTSFDLHTLSPVIFFHYDPFGLSGGLSYQKAVNDAKTYSDGFNNQTWSLKPDNSLSFFFKFYWPEFGRVPIGVSLNYEIAFKLISELQEELYQQASFGFHINFSYYSQFQLLYTFVNSQKDQTIARVIDDDNNETLFLDDINRYYIDFIIIFQITEYFSLKIGMGQLLYSELESPMSRFNVGINYLFPIH